MLMIRYSYNTQINPPGPFVFVQLRRPRSEHVLSGIPAQVDCAADRTVLPTSLVRQLQLVELDRIPAAGLAGHVEMVTTHAVEIGIELLPLYTVEVLAADEPYVLLGRDVLNRYRVVLDGPRQKLEIE